MMNEWMDDEVNDGEKEDVRRRRDGTGDCVVFVWVCAGGEGSQPGAWGRVLSALHEGGLQFPGPAGRLVFAALSPVIQL